MSWIPVPPEQLLFSFSMGKEMFRLVLLPCFDLFNSFHILLLVATLNCIRSHLIVCFVCTSIYIYINEEVLNIEKEARLEKREREGEGDVLFVHLLFRSGDAQIRCYSNPGCTSQLTISNPTTDECCVNDPSGLSFDTSGESCANCVGMYMESCTFYSVLV